MNQKGYGITSGRPRSNSYPPGDTTLDNDMTAIASSRSSASNLIFCLPLRYKMLQMQAGHILTLGEKV